MYATKEVHWIILRMYISYLKERFF